MFEKIYTIGKEMAWNSSKTENAESAGEESPAFLINPGNIIWKARIPEGKKESDDRDTAERQSKLFVQKPFPTDNLMKYKMKNKPNVNIVEI